MCVFHLIQPKVLPKYLGKYNLRICEFLEEKNKFCFCCICVAAAGATTAVAATATDVVGGGGCGVAHAATAIDAAADVLATVADAVVADVVVVVVAVVAAAAAAVVAAAAADAVVVVVGVAAAVVHVQPYGPHSHCYDKNILVFRYCNQSLLLGYQRLGTETIMFLAIWT